MDIATTTADDSISNADTEYTELDPSLQDSPEVEAPIKPNFAESVEALKMGVWLYISTTADAETLATTYTKELQDCYDTQGGKIPYCTLKGLTGFSDFKHEDSVCSFLVDDIWYNFNVEVDSANNVISKIEYVSMEDSE